MDLRFSNSLVDLAARIRHEHEATSAALKSSVAHAMAAGDLLLEAKTQVPHGQWLPWLKEHCLISERTAQLYMRVATNRTQIEAKTQHVADLTVRGAVALISAPKSVEKAVTTVSETVVDGLSADSYESMEMRCIIEVLCETKLANLDPEIGQTVAAVWASEEYGKLAEAMAGIDIERQSQSELTAAISKCRDAIQAMLARTRSPQRPEPAHAA
jgi:hypothetical protein